MSTFSDRLLRMFPRGMTTPWFTSDQDSILNRILNYYKTNTVATSIEEASLKYVQEDASDVVNFPPSNPFTSANPSPGSVALTENSVCLVADGENNTLASSDTSTITGSVQCEIQGISNSYIRGATRSSFRNSSDLTISSGVAVENISVEGVTTVNIVADTEDVKLEGYLGGTGRIPYSNSKSDSLPCYSSIVAYRTERAFYGDVREIYGTEIVGDPEGSSGGLVIPYDVSNKYAVSGIVKGTISSISPHLFDRDKTGGNINSTTGTFEFPFTATVGLIEDIAYLTQSLTMDNSAIMTIRLSFTKPTVLGNTEPHVIITPTFLVSGRTAAVTLSPGSIVYSGTIEAIVIQG